MAQPFQITRRVEFADTDMAGIMHFSNFFRFMEVAETSFLQSLGYSVAWLREEGRFGFPRVSVSCDYFAPIRFEEIVTISVTVEKVGNKSVSYRYDFTRGEDRIATGRMTAVYCRKRDSGEIEPLEIPSELRTQLES
jgi:acyl-CoA thioester hydrolase